MYSNPLLYYTVDGDVIETESLQFSEVVTVVVFFLVFWFSQMFFFLMKM